MSLRHPVDIYVKNKEIYVRIIHLKMNSCKACKACILR